MPSAVALYFELANGYIADGETIATAPVYQSEDPVLHAALTGPGRVRYILRLDICGMEKFPPCPGTEIAAVAIVA
jgi:hypothetical protein